MITPSSRKLYFTFPPHSTFREEDVFCYFSIFGPVQDVRIPYQQKRMFGFATFLYPETVNLVLSKRNPHFVCNDSVIVKPYREETVNLVLSKRIPHFVCNDCVIVKPHREDIVKPHRETVNLVLSKRIPHFVCNDCVIVKPYRGEIPDKKLATKNVEVNDIVHKDMLSDLPDCVILHILSFLSIKHAVGTCILSSRWKDLWKCLPAFIFRRSDFPTNKIFTEFVSKVLLLRDSSVSLHTLDIENRSIPVKPHILEWFVNYAISHNVERLRLSVTSGTAQIPVALFSSQTLTHLTLSICYGCQILFPKSLNLPALSTLELEYFTFSVDDNDCAEPFSTFNMLNRLLISDCTVKGLGTLYISNAALVNFTIFSDLESYSKIVLCTPSLCTFAFRGVPYRDIFGSNISSLKHVDIDAIDAGVFPYSCRSPLILFNWLSEFDNIKSLTVTASTLQVLSLIPGLLKIKIPSLGKLKSLKVKIDEIQYELRLTLCHEKLWNIESKKEAARIQKAFDLGLEPYPLVPDGIVDFLLQNSPSAEVDLVDCRKKPLRKRHL
ncbi:unnamed protein product [Lathyrus sativus]|nr:unnamed protein product [Lathyrus sativus]